MQIEAKKTFKDYYADPAFRMRHQEYMKQYIKCDCGALVQRSNLTHHKRTKKHKEAMKNVVAQSNDLRSKLLDENIHKYLIGKLSASELCDYVTMVHGSLRTF